MADLTDETVPAAAARILALLDSVEDQLRAIRRWADRLAEGEKGNADDGT